MRPTPAAVDTRALHDIGRIARLELRFSCRGGRTVLSHAYAEPPFRVGKCFDDGRGLHLVLASSAPGVFGGDRFEQSVVLEPEARVRLTSQSSLQVHPDGDRGEATIRSRFVVAAGAALVCDWHPLIPFPEARLDQQIAIDVDEGSELTWSDAVMSGREARGERWQFERIGHELRLAVAGRLSYLERYVLEPDRAPLAASWRGSDACYFGTILRLSPSVDQESVEVVHRALQAARDVRAAADLIEPGLSLVRLMASAGAPFHAARAGAMAHAL